MAPPQAKYTNDMQSMYCAFHECREFVLHTVQQGRHDLRSLHLTGFVWNTDAEAFLHKLIDLEVYTKDDDWAEWAERIHGRTDICGDITIAANVDRAEYPPIRITVGVTLELWRDFRQIAQASIDAGFHVQAQCGFWCPGGTLYGLGNLDISNESTYPLHSFDMTRSTQLQQSKA